MDDSLRFQLLAALARDRQFLQASAIDVNPATFLKVEERAIAAACIDFWNKWEEPIGGLLASETEGQAKVLKIGIEGKKKIALIIDAIFSGKVPLVSVKALTARVKELKEAAFYEGALNEIIVAYEKGELSADTLASVIDKADLELRSADYHAIDFFDDESIDNRDARRKVSETYPVCFIPRIDRVIRLIGRGMLAMFLAPPASGKGYALVWMGMSYMKQGYNVLHFTLEDPKKLVEDRYDAGFTRTLMRELPNQSERLKRLLAKRKSEMQGRLKIVDCTDGGWTVTMFEKVWEEEKRKGFIADAIIIDYDDEIKCEKIIKGDNVRRFEFHEIYIRLRALAKKLDVFLWTAGQTSKVAEDKPIVKGKDAAEDYSKIRKCFLAIGIGVMSKLEDVRVLHVLRHRLDKSKFTAVIKSNYAMGLFYDWKGQIEYEKTEVVKGNNG